MRYLIITDIHANLPAFEAVLADAKGTYDKVWCLGDLVSIGSHPNECVELLLALDHVCVAGADDWIVLGKDERYENEILEELPPHSRSSFLHTRELLTDRVRNYLDGLPTKIIEEQFTLVHGSPRHPLWEYVSFPVVAQANFKYLETDYCLVGHNHAPLIFEETTEPEDICRVFAPDPDRSEFGEVVKLGSQRSIINPGAIGGGTACHLNLSYSFYGILDTEASTFEFRYIPLKTNPFMELRKKQRSKGSTVKPTTKFQSPVEEKRFKQNTTHEKNTLTKVVEVTTDRFDIEKNLLLSESTKVFLNPIVAVKTDKGVYRKFNEDSAYSFVSALNNCALLIVADGMGGAEVGKMASQIVVDTISGELRDLFEMQVNTKFSEEYLIDRLHLAFRKVNLVLKEHQPSDRGATSTVCCVFLQDDQAIIANIGDCHVYHFRDNQLRLVTNNRPFMLGERVFDGGFLGTGLEIRVNWPYTDESNSDPGIIMAFVQLNFWKEMLQAGDRLLLCSDGLWSEIDSSEIENCLALSSEAKETANQLIEAAKAKSGRDNITVIVCEMRER